MNPDSTIKIAVQKSGRLSESSLSLLRSIGLQFETYENRLFTKCRNVSVDILFLRDDDIPEYVQNGVADIGIVGKNVLQERQLCTKEILPLDFGYCRLCLASSEQKNCTKVQDVQGKRIATSYPNILKKYLRQQSVQADVVYLRGSVEIAPALNVADAIFDLVSTGSTLRTNRLQIISEVMKSQAMLIGGNNPSSITQQWIDRFVLRIQGLQKARQYKYIMFNLPKAKLKYVTELVPGSKSPTVIPLSDSAYVAVHSVVLEDDFWQVIERIKDFGGSDILVSPIEKFVT